MKDESRGFSLEDISACTPQRPNQQPLTSWHLLYHLGKSCPLSEHSIEPSPTEKLGQNTTFGPLVLYSYAAETCNRLCSVWCGIWETMGGEDGQSCSIFLMSLFLDQNLMSGWWWKCWVSYFKLMTRLWETKCLSHVFLRVEDIRTQQ